MILNKASFINYRNIKEAHFDFYPGMNIIFGKNAQGKTNVLEGIYNFSNGKSFRKTKDKELINFDEDYSNLEIVYTDSKRENKLKIEYFKDNKKKLYINGIKEQKVSNFTSNFKSVLFCPEHLSIIKDDASVRRGFIDSAIQQLRPLYGAYILDYSKILDEKNALLKNTEEYNKQFYDMYFVLSQRIAKYSAYIMSMRSSYLKRLFKNVEDIMKDISQGKEKISYVYNCKVIDENNDGYSKEENEKILLNIILNNTEKEIASKSSLYGAHKDDFEIYIDGKNSKIYSSQGQQRSIALSMKLSEGNICFEETKEHPIFLFDDVLSELDRERKEYILNELKDRQVIVTSCDETDFNNVKNVKKIQAIQGTFKEI